MDTGDGQGGYDGRAEVQDQIAHLHARIEGITITLIAVLDAVRVKDQELFALAVKALDNSVPVLAKHRKVAQVHEVLGILESLIPERRAKGSNQH